ncbi:phenylalanine--tRNA ligase subunit beta, partial [bacterium]|nr:phenylalanine--tRNA ligase subunit beta [bacterium]
MKLSIAWIFDHIGVDWKKYEIRELVEKFNTTSAEVEGFERVVLDLDQFSLAKVSDITNKSITVDCVEWGKEIELPFRDDAIENVSYLIKKDGAKYCWAKMTDFHSIKEHLMPAVFCDEHMQNGEWKKNFEADDYILDIDNKSLTHRPDLWGHRGIAREVAAILDVPFLDEKKFLSNKPIEKYDSEYKNKDKNEFSIVIGDTKVCRRFAGLCGDIDGFYPSQLWMAARLAKVDTRPISMLVDATNYVMLDISQPMHAFDADTISSLSILVRLAKKGEKLTLIDDQELKLTTDDIVVTDGTKPIALAGVMGGKNTEITTKTTKLFLESANFDPGLVRKTSSRFDVRTEASARFEKSLDPMQNTTGILRFLKLFEDANVNLKTSKHIISVGPISAESILEIEHNFLEKRIGVSLKKEQIVSTLSKLGFKVDIEVTEKKVVYKVVVPTFRGTKDITIPEDIVEEVLRFYGFDSVPLELPRRAVVPQNNEKIYRLRKIKNLLAEHLKMYEASNYPFYNQAFLEKINWKPQGPVSVKNPVSENWKHLVSTLIPGLLASVEHNAAQRPVLRFFEWARVWFYDQSKKDKVIEQKILSGILFDANKSIDFYEAKALLCSVFELVGMDVSWVQQETVYYPWFKKYQTAQLLVDGQVLGVAGKVDPLFFGDIVDGDAFIFELNGDMLLDYKVSGGRYKKTAKYPSVWLDISVFVPLAVMVDDVQKLIFGADDRVKKVELKDFFEK